MTVDLPSHRPSKTSNNVPLRYLKAWTALFVSLTVFLAALTGLLITLGY